MTIIVGKNNIGKSTIIEMLKIIAIITQRYQNLTYLKPPAWTGLPYSVRGVSPSIKNMQFNTKNIFNRYGEPPAEIIAFFENGRKIHIYIGTNFEIYAVLSKSGDLIHYQKKASSEHFLLMNVLPQVAPLSRDEELLKEDYVRASVSSSISYLHFRNQLRIFSEYYNDLKRISGETWKGLNIESLEIPPIGSENPTLSLLVRDNDFVSEIAWMGHGLQMWLQTMWFLARNKDSDILAMDEPDVYMHADLQKKLIRMLKNYKKQVIIATHSIEIMSEVNPDQILVVDKDLKESVFLSSTPGLQDVIDNIGGITNLQLSRLWSAKKCLIVEGKDLIFLRKLNDIIGQNKEAIDNIPNFSLSGWGGWNYAIGSKLAIKNTFDERILTYCIFDSDYHTEKQIKNRMTEAKERAIELHIWKKKEIENYFIIPDVLIRIIDEKTNGKEKPTLEEINKKLLALSDELKDELIDKFAETLFSSEKIGITESNKIARKMVNSNWGDINQRLTILSGKELIKRISKWCLTKYGFNLNSNIILECIKSEEIDIEIKYVLDCIANGKNL